MKSILNILDIKTSDRNNRNIMKLMTEKKTITSIDDFNEIVNSVKDIVQLKRLENTASVLATQYEQYNDIAKLIDELSFDNFDPNNPVDCVLLKVKNTVNEEMDREELIDLLALAKRAIESNNKVFFIEEIDPSALILSDLSYELSDVDQIEKHIQLGTDINNISIGKITLSNKDNSLSNISITLGFRKMTVIIAIEGEELFYELSNKEILNSKDVQIAKINFILKSIHFGQTSKQMNDINESLKTVPWIRISDSLDALKKEPEKEVVKDTRASRGFDDNMFTR